MHSLDEIFDQCYVKNSIKSVTKRIRWKAHLKFADEI